MSGLLVAMTAALISGLAMAQAVSDETMDTLRSKLSHSLEVASGNQLEIVGMSATPLADIVEVELSTGELLYSNVSGDYLFAGDMFRSSDQGLVNLSASTRQVRIKEKIARIPESEMILFTPDDVKASITVFTDVDCTYCRRLHAEIEELMDLGIQVRYVAYPRGGENSTALNKMISVWCSDDRQKSLTQAKNGQNLPERDCETPVLEHYNLGNEVGISGTPALVFPDGRLIPGYIESERLGAMLLP
ncbi:MAG: DsbC family protein [Pseudohongiellaceae bacterium]